MRYIGVTEGKIENLKKDGKMSISILIFIYTIHFAYLNKKNKQFLDSLMDKSLSFALNRYGFESNSVSFFILSFNLLVFILDFVYTWIYLFESGTRLFNKYTRRNVNNCNKSICNNSLHTG